jgi:Rho-binding antiterminator
MDRCDFIDILEESAVTGRPVSVELKDGRHFVDQVRDVITDAGEDWADFRDHQRVPVSSIGRCGRAEPREPTYAGKLG